MVSRRTLATSTSEKMIEIIIITVKFRTRGKENVEKHE